MLQGKGAVSLSKAMYEGKNVGVTSTLCYGIQWDAMLDFIKDANYNVSDSSEWGNDSAYNNEKLLKTGSSDSFDVKNIFDVAGNACEWTMETTEWSEYKIIRGGCCHESGTDFSASDRKNFITYKATVHNGFRIALYIN